MEEQEKEEIIEEIISDEVEAIEENDELEEIEQAEEKVENTKTEVIEEVSETFEQPHEYDYVTRTKPIGKLVFMVAFTAVMLVSSTYAWFSAQKNVTLGGLTGTVRVAEGLEISLDAKHWGQEVDFSKYTDQNDLKKMYGIKTDGTVTGHTYIENNLDANDIEHNIIPSELLPVSTTGTSGNGIGLTDMNMYRGIVNQKNAITSLSEVITVMKNTTGYTAYVAGGETTVGPAHHDYPGYYAIDIFLKNTTTTTESGTTNYSKILQLNNDSVLQLMNEASLTTGLQNTVRVAFAVYEADGAVATDIDEDGTVSDLEWTEYLHTAGVNTSNHMTASQIQILNAYSGKNIHDVAIWEPNASDHVQYIVDNYVDLPEFSLADTKLYINPSATVASKDVTSTTQLMRTYALTKAADTANTVTKIYDWATTRTELAGQITLQTEKTSSTNYAIADGVKNLVSVTSPATTVYKTGAESGVVNLKIQNGTVAKLRMYVWLEGQDVDCINYASHGGGIHLDVGLLKDAIVGDVAAGGGTSEGTTSLGTYLPSGFTEVAAATATSALTIKDGDGNQYVWIEVPRNATVYDEVGTNLNLDSLSGTALTTKLDDIEQELIEYAGDYRPSYDEYEDIYSSLEETGIANATVYDNLKYTMLKSVYQNEGFYIGKYETGTMTERTTEGQSLTTAVIKQNAYPYNYVTNAQAQTLATGMASGDRTSSLLFGIQWDLVLRYLEGKGVDQDLLLDNSSSWGHYEASKPIQTGSNSTYSKMGIYDLAGNVVEWTLENYTSSASSPCTRRGGDYFGNGDGSPVSGRGHSSPDLASSHCGFRVTLY